MKKYRALFFTFIMFAYNLSAQENQATTNDCIPSFLEVDKKYRIGIGERSYLIKVKTIPVKGCVIEVKDVVSDINPEVPVSNEKKKRYWVNVNQISYYKHKNSTD